MVAFVSLSFSRRVSRLDVPTYDRLTGVWPGLTIKLLTTLSHRLSQYLKIEITNFMINIKLFYFKYLLIIKMDQDRIFLTDFIEIYKCHPALWNTKSDLSKNKHLRAKGIDALLALCKEKYYEANEAFVKRKINNLRTAFRRELNKVQQSKRTGSSLDDICVSSVWYYDLLLFTAEDACGKWGMSSLDDDVEFKVSNSFRTLFLTSDVATRFCSRGRPIFNVPTPKNVLE